MKWVRKGRRGRGKDDLWSTSSWNLFHVHFFAKRKTNRLPSKHFKIYYAYALPPQFLLPPTPRIDAYPCPWCTRIGNLTLLHCACAAHILQYIFAAAAFDGPNISAAWDMLEQSWWPVVMVRGATTTTITTFDIGVRHHALLTASSSSSSSSNLACAPSRFQGRRSLFLCLRHRSIWIWIARCVCVFVCNAVINIHWERERESGMADMIDRTISRNLSIVKYVADSLLTGWAQLWTWLNGGRCGVRFFIVLYMCVCGFSG